jgi:hypothetical protein
MKMRTILLIVITFIFSSTSIASAENYLENARCMGAKAKWYKLAQEEARRSQAALDQVKDDPAALCKFGRAEGKRRWQRLINYIMNSPCGLWPADLEQLRFTRKESASWQAWVEEACSKAEQAKAHLKPSGEDDAPKITSRKKTSRPFEDAGATAESSTSEEDTPSAPACIKFPDDHTIRNDCIVSIHFGFSVKAEYIGTKENRKEGVTVPPCKPARIPPAQYRIDGPIKFVSAEGGYCVPGSPRGNEHRPED